MPDLHIDPTYLASGYTLVLYCKYKHRYPHVFRQEFFADGKRSYSEARRRANDTGWVIHRDGTATCPSCNKSRY